MIVVVVDLTWHDVRQVESGGGVGVQIIEVTDFGVRSAVIRLRRRGTPLQFVLYPMVHVATPGFFASVAARLKRADLVVAEGVRRSRAGGSVLVSAFRRIDQ